MAIKELREFTRCRRIPWCSCLLFEQRTSTGQIAARFAFRNLLADCGTGRRARKTAKPQPKSPRTKRAMASASGAQARHWKTSSNFPQLVFYSNTSVSKKLRQEYWNTYHETYRGQHVVAGKWIAAYA